MSRQCSIDGCGRPHRSKGYCGMHAERARRGCTDMTRPARYAPVGIRAIHSVEHPPDGGDGCWEWTGNRDPHGYGRITVAKKTKRAHRVVYEHFKGPIPEGLVIDHLCRNPGCVNPDHLEAVTIKVNTLRGVSVSARNAVKTHCIHGHEFTPENTYRRKTGRACRACLRVAWKRHRAKKRSNRP